MLIDKKLLDEVTERAKASERLRMNYNLHDSLEAKAQRLLNALENLPGWPARSGKLSPIAPILSSTP